MILDVVLNVAALATMPFACAGVAQRTKSLWAGRKGPPLFQLYFDVARLLRKSSVYSTTTTPLFRIAPYVVLVTACFSAGVAPLLGARPLFPFAFDFVWLAYLWGLGRGAAILAALDTGSSFEGMGAAREATFATILEPALFLVVGALSLLTRTHTLHEALSPRLDSGAAIVVWAAGVIALTICLQVEAGRVPVDDPATHLELTMVHEVMVLDHSGPDLAAIQVASAMKLFIGASIVATLVNPWTRPGGAGPVLFHIGTCLALMVVIGTIESLVGRLKLRAVPQYILVALSSGVVALLAAAWRLGGGA